MDRTHLHTTHIIYAPDVDCEDDDCKTDEWTELIYIQLTSFTLLASIAKMYEDNKKADRHQEGNQSSDNEL